jgi:predicted AlkP superfamily pyrophosphatase or phosphodiesterase
MKRHSARSFVLALLFCLSSLAAAAGSPKLVLFLTIDQLRGDMPWRFKDRFRADGIRYLMDHGAVFANAHYRHAATFTATGHAALFTGGHAAAHGFVGNEWYDTRNGRRVYCVEDSAHSLIGQAPEAHSGTSPRNLTSTTIGDELILSSNGRSRLFSVSIKDRGAIIPGGYLGKAFWYEGGTGRFVTSTYYYRKYPDWVSEWNRARHADQYLGQQWRLLDAPDRYTYADQDERSYEKSYQSLGITFPHPFGSVASPDFYKTLRFTPMGDALTVAFVKELIDKERLGQTGAADFLAVSLSATDYIGHAFGPNSLEAEDNLLQLDKTLADLLTFIDQRIGLKNTLVVLSSDHGVDAVPEYKQSLGIPAGRLKPDLFIEQLNQQLKNQFKVQDDLVIGFWNPSLYLDSSRISAAGLDIANVEQAAAEAMLEIPGIALAVTRTDLLSGRVGEEPILQRVKRSFNPARSGNVLIVQSPSWFLHSKYRQLSAMHGSPYPYDTHVPIMIAGPGIPALEVHRRVAPEDIAPTLAAYLGIESPTGSTGDALVEVFRSE